MDCFIAWLCWVGRGVSSLPRGTKTFLSFGGTCFSPLVVVFPFVAMLGDKLLFAVVVYYDRDREYKEHESTAVTQLSKIFSRAL